MTDHAITDRIGIDGGGTACRVALVWQGQRFEATTGPANVTSDRDAAIDAVHEGLRLVAKQAGVPLNALHALPAYAGLAGVTGPEVAQAVARALPLRSITVEDDRRASVTGALRATDGAVLGVGTGSFVALQSQGDVRFAGGYGLILGDEGSGAWLGRALLTRVLHAMDGLESHSALTQTTLTRFGDAEGIVRFAAAATPKDFAALAPDVLRAAEAQDATAIALMQAGADHMARAVQALGWQPGMPLCLLGGIAPHYATILPSTMARAVVAPEGTALDGALILAGLRDQESSG